jgi:type III restriction enzyme
MVPIQRVIAGMMDFRGGGAPTVGQGSRMQILQEIGSGANAVFEWVEVEHSNRVTARAVFRRELQRLYAGGLRRAGGPVNLVEIEQPKFDARIEINSPAAHHIRETARQVVDAYIENSRILQNDDDPPFAIGPVAVDPTTATAFSNALHSQYSGLNRFELIIAQALDRTQRVWCRNQEGSGYFIPLLDRGSTATFWPDFLVWIDRVVVAIDTKGDHLLSEDARRKLFDIDGTGGRARIVVRLVSEGQWHIAQSGQIGKRGEDGYTVWRWINGRLSPALCPGQKEAVECALAL